MEANLNDIVCLFLEAMSGEERTTILDVGGVLKEREITSRKYKEYEVKNSQVLDVLTEERFREKYPEYDSVYNDFYSLESINDESYDEIMILTEPKGSEEYVRNLMLYCVTHAKWVIILPKYRKILESQFSELNPYCNAMYKDGCAYFKYDMMSYLSDCVNNMVEAKEYYEALCLLQVYDSVISMEYDFLYVAASLSTIVGEHELGKKFGERALELRPDDEQVQKLLERYK